MTLITQIEDKGAVVAWSPIVEYADVIALGSKVRFSFSSLLFFNCVYYMVDLLII